MHVWGGNGDESLTPDLLHLLKKHFVIRKEPIVRLTKSFKVEPNESAPRSFTGYASTFTRTPDCYGDVVVKGAFVDSLAEWEKSGKSIPVLWLHDMHEPASYVAKVVDIFEDEHGLKVTGEFFDDDPTAMKVYRLLKENLVNEMSFAFDIVDSGTVKEGGVEVRELRKVNLFECSVVPFGANPDTSIESVKSGAEGFSADEIAALKEVAAKSVAPRGGEVAGKADEAEARQRVEKMQARFAALSSEKGDSK